MDKKLDVLIKNGKKESEQKSENTEKQTERKEIVIDTLALAEPALTAVCK